jgi:hypothetical protein
MLTRRLAVHPADAQLLTHNSHLLQAAEDIPGHALGQVDECVIVADVHVADVLPFQAGLVGDRADDIARLYAVGVPDFETESFEGNIAIFATAPTGARTALAFGGVPATVCGPVVAAAVPCWDITS